MLGGIGVRRRRGRQKMRWLDGITDSMDVVNLSELRELVMKGRPGVLQFRVAKTEWLNWNEQLVGFPGGSDGKVSAYNVGNPGSIPGSGRSPGEGNGNPPQSSCLENPMDGEAWWTTVHGVTKSRTRLSDFTLMWFSMLIYTESDQNFPKFTYLHLFFFPHGAQYSIVHSLGSFV